MYEYCHATFEEMFKASGDSLTAIFDEENWEMPLVHAEASYKSPMKLGERLSIALSIGAIGKTSVTVNYKVSGEDGTLRAQVELVHVVIDGHTFQPRPVTERLINAFKQCDVLPATDND